MMTCDPDISKLSSGPRPADGLLITGSTGFNSRSTGENLS
jgi:hypothetical protein